MILSTTPSVITDAGQVAGAFAAVIGLVILLWQVTRRTIVSTVAPLIDASRAASKEQHDAQSAAMGAGFAAVTERLDRGAETIERHTQQIRDLERDLRTPHPRTVRTPHGDEPDT